MLITGTTPPVVRATIMGIIIILTFLSNRSTNIFNSISIAAVIILLFSPQQIYDPGFQLSFGAVLSTAIIYPYIQSSIEKLNLKFKWFEKILLFMGVSLSAQIGTIPFTLIYFSKLSVVSILANLFVIPISGVLKKKIMISSAREMIHNAMKIKIVTEYFLRYSKTKGNISE